LAYKSGLTYKQKRRTIFNPTLIIIILVIVFLLLCIIGNGTFKGFGCSKDTSELQTYINQVKKIADRTNKVGTDFADLRTNMKSLARKDLKARLDALAKDSRTIAADAAKIPVPSEMNDANTYLLVALNIRTAALESYQPAIFNALQDTDLEVSGKQVSLALKDLAFSDRAFEIFKDKAQKVLKGQKITFVAVPASVFIAGDTEFEQATVLEFLKNVKESGDLTEKHGIAISEMVVEPVSLSENNGVFVLPQAATITVTVTIENQGNQLEVNIPVNATLKSETAPKPQTKKSSIGSLPPGQKKTIKITGLKPTPGDIINMLSIEAGPVPKESFLDNNIAEYKFTMERK
jgi:hypothetical protein